MTEEDRYFKFRNQNKAILFVDGNYMINISRALSLKIDMERLFDDITKEFFRQKTYWFSAIESNLERSNSTFRFLDRLKYIPRTEVYIGRLTKRYSGNYESALRNDAGSAMIAGIVEQSMMKTADYIIIIGSDPEYIPAIRVAQKHGCLVRLVSPANLSDFRPHSELSKVVDERIFIETEFLLKFEYIEERDQNFEENLDDEIENKKSISNPKKTDSNEDLEIEIENQK